MSTSADKPRWPKKSKEPMPPHAFVPAAALAQAVDFDDDMMRVTFMDGRVLAVPLAWFPRLRKATPKQRAKVQIGGGISLHWPALDEDLSIAGLMAGVDWRSA